MEVEEGNKKHRGGKIRKIVEQEIKTLRREIKLKRERGK